MIDRWDMVIYNFFVKDLIEKRYLLVIHCILMELYYCYCDLYITTYYKLASSVRVDVQSQCCDRSRFMYVTFFNLSINTIIYHRPRQTEQFICSLSTVL
jgi:hypothetical protein